MDICWAFCKIPVPCISSSHNTDLSPCLSLLCTFQDRYCLLMALYRWVLQGEHTTVRQNLSSARSADVGSSSNCTYAFIYSKGRTEDRPKYIIFNLLTCGPISLNSKGNELKPKNLLNIESFINCQLILS